MATLSVLTFDREGHPIQFDTWIDELQLYLLSDSRDGVLLFDLTSGASLAPPATADSATRSQWLTCDAAARLAIRNHLPLAERAHFGQHKTAKALYVDVVARYSSPATAALSRLILPYLFPELSAFATVEDLITHLRTSDTRYRAALKAGFLDKNPPPMYIIPQRWDANCSERGQSPVDFLTKALHFPAFNLCSVAVGQVCLAEIGNDDDAMSSNMAGAVIGVRGAPTHPPPSAAAAAVGDGGGGGAGDATHPPPPNPKTG
ncbi:unnamed protein product [Closterium sp. NIES-54]